jgi:hypothetical protein
MSDPSESPHRPPGVDAPPPLGVVLRYYGPWLAGIGALAIVLAAYFDLRSRIATLEARVGGEPIAPEGSESSRGRITASEAPSATGDAPPAPTVVERSPAPRWECRGEIAQDLVRQSIGRHGSSVFRCIEQRRQAAPDLAGTLVLRLRVASGGAVDSVHVAGVEDDELVRCVGNAALTWRFPPPANGACAVVEAPFALGR